MDSFIIGALTALVLGLFTFLFKKPTKKSHLYIQNTFLVLLAIVCLISLFSSFAFPKESLILILPISIVVVPGEFFIIRKLLKNLEQLKNGSFKE